MTQYFDELDRRFPTGFDPGDTLVADAPTMRAPRGVFVVAHSDGDPVACGGVRSVDDATGEIKRMWVHPELRGVGIGQRMLRHLEDRARQLGHGRAILDTNSTLVEAITMYEHAGYVPIERYNDNPYAARSVRQGPALTETPPRIWAPRISPTCGGEQAVAPRTLQIRVRAKFRPNWSGIIRHSDLRTDTCPRGEK